MQLAAFNTNNFNLGQASVSINEGLPLYVVARLEQRYDLSTMCVGVLGMSFKAESDDIRSSLSYKLKRILKFKSRRVLTHDPYVTTDPDLVDLDDGAARGRPARDRRAARLLPRPRDLGARRRHLEPARRRGAGVSEPLAPRVSVVIPVYNEGDAIVGCLDRILAGVTLPCEILVVFDDDDDTTVEPLRKYATHDPRVVPTRNTYGRGPARAIRYGIDHVRAPVAVVTMADGSDDAEQIDELCKLVERGVVIAAASRYMSGGQQIDGPFIKSQLSRLAGLSLFWFARVGTRDATNSFKAYSVDFVRDVDIDSDTGFEIGIELVSKARRLRRPVAEIPTIWLERAQGTSNFKVAKWIPRYLKWYRFAFGPKLSLDDVRAAGKELRS